MKKKNRFKAGAINMYNDKFDYLTPKNAIPLLINEKIALYNWVSTIEPTFAEIITTKEDLNVFASDAVIATIMTAPLAVYPWDISVTKLNGKIILDIDESKIFNYTTIFESATNPPEDDPKKDKLSVNGPKKLSWEATMSNHYFSQQALLPETTYELGPDPNFNIPEGKDKPKKGYVYKAWEIEKGIKLCVRCQVDAYLKLPKVEKVDTKKKSKEEHTEEEKKVELVNTPINLRALNEFYEMKRQVTWKQAYENNRSLLMSEVSTNDAIKLSKWTIEALLSGVEHLRVAYLSRKKIDDNKKHDIIGVQRFTTKEMKGVVNLNYEYMWGILKTIIAALHGQEDGSYYLLKDPNRFIIRLYKKIKLPDEEAD